MKIKASLILILVCLLVDDFLAYLFPADPTYVHFSLISHLGFLALMLIVLLQHWLTRILLSFLCGIVTDFFFVQSFPLHTILYTLLGYVCGLLGPWIQDRVSRRTLVIFVAMLLVDLLPFAWFSWFGGLTISFKQWLLTYALGSWVINGLFLLGLEHVLGVMDRYYTIRQNRILRQERRKYRKLRFSQK